MQTQRRFFSKEEIERFIPIMEGKQTGTGVTIVGNIAWLHVKPHVLIPPAEVFVPYIPYQIDDPQLDLSDDFDLIQVMDNINNKTPERVYVYKSNHDVTEQTISKLKHKYNHNACVVHDVPFILRSGLEKKQAIIMCSTK